MQPEEGRGEPGAGNRETSEDQPNADRVGGVQCGVHEMVAGRTESPQMMLDPKCCEDDGVVLGRRFGLEPNLPQSAERTKRAVFGDVIVVIPNEGRRERRQIDARPGKTAGIPPPAASSRAVPPPGGRDSAIGARACEKS